ncbi:FG-GAP repeat domain-containing protein [Tautonia plasticadhaerens]|uniref:FG-GAP repeat protein n=1 Tax=Tautonia plasticadhaerens TaxID=2527974 RepID=A0A518HB80_9BACT|nr:VCBS repeat-containing protein [Tautonia plasticadhaerens]QDV38118.1 FG-GAP repeat protein [Tautonia plasticadhaerens]
MSARTFSMLCRSALALLLGAGMARADGESGWTKHAINDRSPFEAAGALDVDGDGVLDVVCGETWYEGPGFSESFKVRDVAQQGTYFNCFATLPVDVNADGRMDYVTCSYFGRDVGWVENPGEAGAPWTYHAIDQPGPSEAAWLVDLTGDGVPEVLPNAVNVAVFYELKDPGPAASWKKYELGSQEAGHGVGTGDVNGDGRTDLLTPKGWFEAPPDPSGESWAFHPEWSTVGGEQGKNTAAGIQILARDVDGDGLSDVVFGMGHDYGLYWLTQQQDDDGNRTWSEPKFIDDTIHQAHTLMWADLDGDEADELVTGTRIYGHEVEPGDTDAPIIASYRFDRDSGDWERTILYRGEAATNAPPRDRAAERDALKDFPRGTAGTGLQMMAVDLDADGDADLLCPGKSGLYWLENPGA